MVLNVLIVLVVSFIVSRILIREITYYALKNRILSAINDRNKRSVMRLGGVPFYPSAFIAIVAVSCFTATFSDSISIYGDCISYSSLLVSLLTASIIFATGVIDDLRCLSYRVKFPLQAICAAFLVCWHGHIDNLFGILGINGINPDIGIILATLAVVFLINAINLIDGIDGLCASISIVSLIFYGVLFFILHHYIYALIAFSMVGAVLPFWYYNIFGIKRKIVIFMGDTGSTILGFLLAFLCICLYCYFPESQSKIFQNPFSLIIAPLVVPVFDAFRVALHRIKKGNNPFRPDLNHIHHKLMSLGLTQHQTLINLVAIQFFFIVLNLLLIRQNINLVLGLDVLLYTLFNVHLDVIKKRKSKES